MFLETALAGAAPALPSDFGTFQSGISPDWIEEALAASGCATLRKRRLPAEQVFWLVVGMALMRNEAIERVCALLGLALPDSRRPLVAKSAIAQARQRLGEQPMEHVFVSSAAEWAQRAADEDRWRGLALYGFDGTTLRVPDSRENWDAFGGNPGNGLRNGSAYPTVRMVALMSLRGRILSALRFGPYLTGEVTLARDLWETLPERSLTIVDRNFAIAEYLCALAALGSDRHWLVRKKDVLKLRTIKRLGSNDVLAEVEVTPKTRRRATSMPARWIVRAITYQRKGYKTSTLLTSLVDPTKYPARELVALYHERWELELGYDEVKTHLLAREETIRSRTPGGVRQEIWGIALAYNLIRHEMHRVAVRAKVPPNRISFVSSLALIRTAWLTWSTPPLAPGRIPQALEDLERTLPLLLLPARRPERSYPRRVKIKMSNYDRKSPAYRGSK